MFVRKQFERKEGSNFFFQLNPTTKFIFLIVFSLTLYMIKELILISIIFIITLIVVPLTGLKSKEVMNSISYLLKIQIFTTVFSIIGWHDDGVPPLFYTFPRDWPLLGDALPIFHRGLYYSVRNPLIISIVLLIALIFIYTTDPPKFAASLNQQLKVPIRVSQCLIIGMNFVPIIQNEMKIIRDAQTARGENLFDITKKKRFRDTISSALSFLTTLMIIILRKVDNLSVSLDKRGLGLYKERTEVPIEWNKKDSIVLVITFLLPIIVLLHNFRVFKLNIPSVFALFTEWGIVAWVTANQWVFTVFIFSVLAFFILLMLKYYIKTKKLKKNLEDLRESTSISESIPLDKLEEAVKLIESIDQTFDHPITAGAAKSLVKI